MIRYSYGIQEAPMTREFTDMDDMPIPKEALEAYWTKRSKSEELRKLFQQQDETMLKAFQQQVEALKGAM